MAPPTDGIRMVETARRDCGHVRPLAWTAVYAVAFALALGFAGRATDVPGLEVAAGLLWLVAIVAGIALLPFWGRILAPVERMPGLFPRPGPDERWCAECGSVAPREGPCGVCGQAAPVRRPRKESSES